jgi:uncharacterized membrane protein
MIMSSQKQKDFIVNNLGAIITTIGAIALAIALCTALFYFNSIKNINHTASDFGQLGDFFGGILNPIFGFMALVAVLLTLYVQRVELSASIEVLKEAREINYQSVEIQRKAAEMNALSSLIEYKKQSSENYARQHSVIVDAIKKRPEGAPTTPSDNIAFNLHLWDTTDYHIYAIRLEKLLSEISGIPRPTAKERNEHAHEVLERNAQNQLKNQQVD